MELVPRECLERPCGQVRKAYTNRTAVDGASKSFRDRYSEARTLFKRIAALPTQVSESRKMQSPMPKCAKLKFICSWCMYTGSTLSRHMKRFEKLNVSNTALENISETHRAVDALSTFHASRSTAVPRPCGSLP